MMKTAMGSALLACSMMVAFVGTDAHADKKRAEAEQRLKKTVADSIPKDQNGKPALDVTFSIDWTGLPERGDGYPAEEWVRECGSLAENFSRLCKVGGSSKLSYGCLGLLNKELKYVRCVGQKDRNDKAGIERKGDSITYRMSFDKGSIGSYPPEYFLLNQLFPTARKSVLGEELVWMGDAHYDNSGAKVPIVFDADSFHDADLGANEIWETCKRGKSFLFLLASPGGCEGFKMCEKDREKAEPYLKNLKRMRCVWTAKEEAVSTEDNGETLVYKVGKWTDSEREWGYAAFWATRKKLAIRSCGRGVMDSAMYGRGPMDDMKRACCPKDRSGKCMKPDTQHESETRCLSDSVYESARKNAARIGAPMPNKCTTSPSGMHYSKKQKLKAR
jgi:hypothetical protein